MVAEKINQTVRPWLSSTSRTTRAVAIVMVMLIGLVLIQSSGLESRQKMSRLLPGCELQPEDLHRIQIGFGQAGLDNFQVIDGEIMVPDKCRAEYLKAIGDREILPPALVEPKSADTNLNPFLSRSQQAMARENQKKQQVCEMIRRLPFVAAAWMEVDSVESDNVFDQDSWSAVVFIQPLRQQQLELRQVATVRQIIAGAFAEMRTENIVVTDLNAGAAYGGEDNRGGEQLLVRQAAWRQQAQVQRLDIENQIRVALSDFEGLQLEVLVSPGEIKTGLPSSPSSQFPKASQDQPIPKHPPTIQAKAGTNGKASISDFQTPSRPLDFSAEQASIPTLSAETPFTGNVEVNVEVPRQLVTKKYPSQDRGWFPRHSGDQELQANFDQLKAEIINRIRPLLPVSSFANTANYPITVKLADAVAPPMSPLMQARAWAQDHLPSLVVLLVGGTLLFVVLRYSHSTGSPEEPQLLSIQSAPAQSESVSGSQQSEIEDAKRQLAELIDQNPEEAANVIKSWIRKAA